MTEELGELTPIPIALLARLLERCAGKHPWVQDATGALGRLEAGAEDSTRLAEGLVKSSLARGDDVAKLYAYAVLAVVYSTREEASQASAALRRLGERLEAVGEPLPRCLGWLFAAEAHRMAGRVEERRSAIDRARGAWDELSALDGLLAGNAGGGDVASKRLEFDALVASREGRIALSLVDAVVAEQADVQSMLGRVLDLLVRAVEAQRGFVLLLDEAGLIEYAAQRQFEAAALPDVSRGLIEVLRTRRRPLAIADTHLEQELAERSSIMAQAPRAVLSAPVLDGDHILGAIYLDRDPDGQGFRQADLDLVDVFSRKIAPALAVSRRLARQRTEIDRLTKAMKEGLRELEPRYRLGALVGRSARMQRFFTLVEKAAPTPYPVLLVGETGTGKELTARAVHFSSPRREGPFLAVNCGALSETLVDSELFGYVKGAFTGAQKDTLGLFESASGGSLFLDEVEAMGLSIQVKLLRVLQESVLTRVGSVRPIRVDVRIIGATNVDPDRLVREGRLREDLYHRLKVIRIDVPPLRERFEDLPLLVDTLMERIRKETGRSGLEVDPAVLGVLAAYPWPGNVRELENELRRLAICAERRITPDLVSEEIRLALPSDARRGGLVQRLEDFERAEILTALRSADWVVQKAARLLQMNRITLLRRIRKYGLQAPSN